MEIETTLADLPKHLENLPYSPKTKIRLFIEDSSYESPMSHWQKLAKRIEFDSPLSGCGELIMDDVKSFRHQSMFKHDVDDL